MSAAEQALSLIHDQLHKGNVDEAHQLVHRALGVEDGVIDPHWPKFFRDFDRAFLLACKKNNVRAAYIIFDHDDPTEPRKCRVLTGGELRTLDMLKLILAAGQHAVAVSVSAGDVERNP